MKCAIIGADFTPGQTGGIETYFRNLIGALQRVDPANRYTVFARGEVLPELRLTAPNFTGIAIRSRAPFLRRAWSAALRRRAPTGQIADPPTAALVDAGDFDVVHFPLQRMNPWGVRSKSVVTFVDIQHEYLPEFFSPELLRARRRSYRPTAEAADHLIAISGYTRQTLMDRYAIAPERISTVHLCYDAAHASPAAADLRLPEPFFFYPAGSWPHKNHGRLLDAFAEVRRSRPEFSLVLTGIARQEDDRIGEQIRRLELDASVARLGYLPYEQLPAVYARAFALVFPSLFEGFGIPLCEAMVAGCPIVAASTTSIPEVAGDAALYFDPMNVTDMAQAMLRMATTPSLREALITAGRRRAPQFTPDAMAEKTIGVYESVARSTR